MKRILFFAIALAIFWVGYEVAGSVYVPVVVTLDEGVPLWAEVAGLVKLHVVTVDVYAPRATLVAPYTTACGEYRLDATPALVYDVPIGKRAIGVLEVDADRCRAPLFYYRQVPYGSTLRQAVIYQPSWQGDAMILRLAPACGLSSFFQGTWARGYVTAVTAMEPWSPVWPIKTQYDPVYNRYVPVLQMLVPAYLPDRGYIYPYDPWGTYLAEWRVGFEMHIVEPDAVILDPRPAGAVVAATYVEQYYNDPGDLHNVTIYVYRKIVLWCRLR